MRRRFQFSLKWLFVAMLAVAVFFAGDANGRRREAMRLEAKQREARGLIFKYGGLVGQTNTELRKLRELRERSRTEAPK